MAGLEYLGFSAIYQSANPNAIPTAQRKSAPPRPKASSVSSTSSSAHSHNRHHSTVDRYAAVSESLSGTMSLSASTISDPRTSNASSTDSKLSQTVKRDGRWYLRDQVYPLPCDLPEINRQTLRSLMLMRAFGIPFCAPYFEDEAPKRILEIACGPGLWSTACNDYFTANRFKKPSFTGVDILNLAPDLRKQGVSWEFVQHDLSGSKPFPFPNESFDFIFIKDASTCRPGSDVQSFRFNETLRMLKPGGVLELWDFDYIIRTLLPNPAAARGTSEEDQEIAEETGTYTVSPATPWTQAQNQYLQDYNKWMQKFCEKQKLTSTPCAFFTMVFSMLSEEFKDAGSRRIAIPFSEMRWEREPTIKEAASTQSNRRKPSSNSSLASQISKDSQRKPLNADQLALRRTALNTFVQMVEGLEPFLLETSGLERDEYDRWWAGFTHNLLEQKGTSSGECLEVGAWWAQKND